MRVNVYAEELREIKDKYGWRVNRLEKQVVEGLKKHQAIEILIGERVPHTINKAGMDDDTPAVKFWYYTDQERLLLASIFQKALEELQKPEARGE